ncbi:MAG: hypothetical protein ACR2OE_17465 [Thermomicrobiales bacterium]
MFLPNDGIVPQRRRSDFLEVAIESHCFLLPGQTDLSDTSLRLAASHQQ